MWLRLLTLVLLALVTIGVGVAWWGARHWATETRDLRARLDTLGPRPEAAFFDPADVEGLPAPVQRFLRLALTPGQPVIRALTLRHEGTFNAAETGERWVPFASHQRVVTQPVGFDWDARIRMAPGMTAHVRDAYVRGEGILVAKLLGVVTVMRAQPSAELSVGEFMRFAAEAPWYPTALLPSEGAEWEPIDERSARVTLRDGAISATLTVTFGDDGLIREVRADSRVRVSKDGRAAMPWGGRFWRYERRD
jgi:hypothetical protein